MEYTQLLRAARLLLSDQGLPEENAEATVKRFLDSPDDYRNVDGELVTPAMVSEFESWFATLSDEEADIACNGLDETEPNEPVTYTGEGEDGEEIRVTIPDNCSRVLAAIFDSMEV